MTCFEGGVSVVWGLRAVVGYVSATCLRLHLSSLHRGCRTETLVRLVKVGWVLPCDACEHFDGVYLDCNPSTGLANL